MESFKKREIGEKSRSVEDWKQEILKEDYSYCYCYCEENIYQLGKQIQQNYSQRIQERGDHLFVLFISNLNKQTLIWQQKSSSDPEEPVCWDYHVIFCVRNNNLLTKDNCIFDFDTLLSFPVSLADYVKQSFRPDLEILARYRQSVRVIPLQVFLDYFASDRSHMAEAKVPVPSWPKIKGPKALSEMNLSDYIDMLNTKDQPESEYGKVYSFQQFLRWCLNTID